MSSKRKRVAAKAKAAPSAPQPLQSAPIRTFSGNIESSIMSDVKRFMLPLAAILVLAVAAAFIYPFFAKQSGAAPYQPPANADGSPSPQAGPQAGDSSAPSSPNKTGDTVSPPFAANNSTNASASNGSGSGDSVGAASNTGSTSNSAIGITGAGSQGSSGNQAGSGQSAPGNNQSSGQNDTAGENGQENNEPQLSTPDSPYATYFGITTGTLANATSGAQYSFALTAVGGTGTYSWYTSALPSGLSLSPSGVIYGVPSQAGVYNVQITVSDGISSSTQYLRITVN